MKQINTQEHVDTYQDHYKICTEMWYSGEEDLVCSKRSVIYQVINSIKSVIINKYMKLNYNTQRAIRTVLEGLYFHLSVTYHFLIAIVNLISFLLCF